MSDRPPKMEAEPALKLLVAASYFYFAYLQWRRAGRPRNGWRRAASAHAWQTHYFLLFFFFFPYHCLSLIPCAGERLCLDWVQELLPLKPLPLRPLCIKTPPSLPVPIPLPRLPLQLPPIPKSAGSSVPQRQTLCWKEEAAAHLTEVDRTRGEPGSKEADGEASEEFYTGEVVVVVVVVVFYPFSGADTRCESVESTDTATSLASTNVHGWRTRGL
ncbi:hypothetical protein TSMEX_000936 [Taenia solium]